MVDSTAESYGCQHVVLSALTAFQQSGCAGPDLIAGLRAEVQHRLANHSFKVVLPYGVCIGTAPGGLTAPASAALAPPLISARPPQSVAQPQPRPVATTAAAPRFPATCGLLARTGGASASPPPPPPPQLFPPPQLLMPGGGGGSFDSASFEAAVASLYPPLGSAAGSGEAPPLLPGEERSASLRTLHRPHARVRLIAIAGMADFAARLQSLADGAPAWLEVRLLDLPGHGGRSQKMTREGLPPCAFPHQPVAADEAAPEGAGDAAATIAATATASLVSRLVDELWPLLVCTGPADEPPAAERGADSSSHRWVPYALFGYSLGSLLAYYIERELARRGAPPPLLLVVVGRTAPHCVTLPPHVVQHLRTCDDRSVVDFIQEKLCLPVPSPAVGNLAFTRAAALYRCGILLGAAHAGTIAGSALAASPCLYDEGASPTHATEPPKVGCPIVALSGALDTVARAPLVSRWAEVAPDGQQFRHATVPGASHIDLRESPAVNRAVYEQLAERVAWVATRGPEAPAASEGDAPTKPSKRPPPIDDDSCLPASFLNPDSSSGSASGSGSTNSSNELSRPSSTGRGGVLGGRDSPLLRAAAMLRAGNAVPSGGVRWGSSLRASPRASPRTSQESMDLPQLRRSASAELVAAPHGRAADRAASFSNRACQPHPLRRSFTAGEESKLEPSRRDAGA